MRLARRKVSEWNPDCLLTRRGVKVEPVVGLEPTTDGLQNRCSTTELNWPPKVVFLRSFDPFGKFTRLKLSDYGAGQIYSDGSKCGRCFPFAKAVGVGS